MSYSPAMNPDMPASARRMFEVASNPVLAELAALRAELAELKQHLMVPQTSLVIGAEAVAAFRRLQKGGAS